MTVTLPRYVVEQAMNALKEMCGGRCNREYNPCWEYEVADRLSSYLDEAPAEPVAWMVVSPDFDAPLIQFGKPAALLKNETMQPLYTQPKRVAHCLWTQDPDYEMGETYASDCGEVWSFVDGGPEDNRVKFCHNCGKPVEVVRGGEA